MYKCIDVQMGGCARCRDTFLRGIITITQQPWNGNDAMSINQILLHQTSTNGVNNRWVCHRNTAVVMGLISSRVWGEFISSYRVNFRRVCAEYDSSHGVYHRWV